ncbi:ATP-binding cassette domain-containing protein [Nesterenkonia sp.]|uniref:ATP-binding cassette domain-containing protein n=1 Tax=Nesterenkonia sp. TaxID=704201 RepID=UPI00260613B3|nr:ATP-binding cassette domain-containing protein [Nesterenkonia sp.]
MKGLLLRRRGRGAAGAAADALRRDPAEAAPAIELEAVTISDAEADGAQRSIVEGFDLSLAPGQIHCLAGRSGSGKTSVLRVATATQAPSSGAVRWAGADVAQLSPDELASHRRRRMGYVDQGGYGDPGADGPGQCADSCDAGGHYG